MDLQISVFLLFILFTAGHSFRCYHCNGTISDACKQTTCNESSSCFTATAYFGKNGTVIKNCSNGCPSGSINAGNLKAFLYLCNMQDAPDPSNNTANGKTCYYCDGQNCSNILNCSGSEGRCLTQTGTYGDVFSKGCVSESICNDTTFSPLILNLTCCEGNLCNGDNVTQSIIQTTTQSSSLSSSFTHSSAQSSRSTHSLSSTQSSTLILNSTQGSSSTQSTTKSANGAQSVTQSFLVLCCSLLSFILLDLYQHLNIPTNKCVI
ncbi:ly6/PLAUR domain-containing protein 3-like [Labeo rohita]|uniref:ly6/PLAUR domain-containing protein 3-like n=1 Tax=Labeo rohita TaxID=84645 RepID=UPI0021E2CF7B|nr:ly6/PLAUR domain-containing protein 3-like [Labeo rohita]